MGVRPREGQGLWVRGEGHQQDWGREPGLEGALLAQLAKQMCREPARTCPPPRPAPRPPSLWAPEGPGSKRTPQSLPAANFRPWHSLLGSWVT